MKYFWLIFMCLLCCGCFDEQQHKDNLILGTYFTPSTECEDNIIQFIQNSKKIDVAVYSISNNKIVNALISSYKEGKNIHIVTDKLQAKGKSSLTKDLISAGIPIRFNKNYKIEHNKFAVFDNIYVVTGSYNWTNAASYKNSENCIFLKYPNNNYIKRFEFLWDLYK